jgi:prepilin-type N-terminal cleavage/methylation domain-containing protein
MKGFTLIEILIVITLIVILAATYFFVANPGGQLASARNSTRSNELQAIMNAVRQNVADQANGQFSCSAGPLPTSSAEMASASGTGTYDIAPCLVPTYLYALPFDPSAPNAHFNSVSDYDTGYTIAINASGTITLAAPYAELGKTISVSR